MVTLEQTINNKNTKNELKAIDTNNGIYISLRKGDYNVIEG